MSLSQDKKLRDYLTRNPLKKDGAPESELISVLPYDKNAYGELESVFFSLKNTPLDIIISSGENESEKMISLLKERTGIEITDKTRIKERGPFDLEGISVKIFFVDVSGMARGEFKDVQEVDVPALEKIEVRDLILLYALTLLTYIA